MSGEAIRLGSDPVGATTGPSGFRARPPACAAPSSSLYLDPAGHAQACCANRWLRFGNAATDSLSSIWRGAAASRLRQAMIDHDLSKGCEISATAIERGDRAGSLAAVFDQFPAVAEPEWPRQLELALSNACNLQCVMCNGELSSAIRIHREGRPPLPSPYDDAFFRQLDDVLPHLERVTFVGGEPFLGAETLRVMERLIELRLRPACHVTTNGTVWSTRVQRIVSLLPMHVMVSIDAASPATYEAIRVGARFAEVRANLDLIRHVTSQTGSGMSLAFCLMTNNWFELAPVLRLADELDVDVFVNDVHHPASLTLHHAPLELLDVIVDGLREEDAARAGLLGRNRRLWDRQLTTVERLRDDRRRGAVGTPRVDGPRADAVFTVLTVGTDLLIREAGSELAAVGFDLRRLVGQPMQELPSALHEAFGDVVESTLSHDEHGNEHRRLVLHDGTATTSVTLSMTVEPEGGQRWTVAVVPPATAPTPVAAGVPVVLARTRP